MTALDIALVEPAAEGAEPDRVGLFTVAGQDYLVDANPDASALLRYLWAAKTDELTAVADLLIGQLGEGPYQTLMNTKGISKAGFQSILTALLTHLGGDDGNPKAPPANRAERRGRQQRAGATG